MNTHATNSLLKPQRRRCARSAFTRVFVALVLCSICLGPWSLASTRPPNVLFLFSDDQRFDTIHALGNREIQTPNLDRLVRRGFAFTHAFCMGAQQGAVCVPSRAMLMTGRSLFRATTTPTSGAIPTALPLWPEVMRRAGYDTIGIGKWHNDCASYARAFTAGGPVFFGGMSDHTKVAVHDFDPTGKYAKERERTATAFSSELFADAAVDFLCRRRSEKPFFLYIAFTAPHDPRTPPKEFADLYPPARITLPKNFLPEHPFDNGELKVRDEALLPWPRTRESVRREIAAYYGMITHLDAQIGRVLQALEDSGQADNTIILFAADNGLAVGRHGLLGKQSLYDHSVRVPLILAGPGVPKGKRSDALCYLFDLFPTLCELTGLSAPENLEGRSLAPILRGQRKRVRSEIFGAYRDVQRMVRNERWKLIHYPKIDRWQLFDLRRNPEEIHDHFPDPDQAARLEAMKRKLTELQLQLDDPLAHR